MFNEELGLELSLHMPVWSTFMLIIEYSLFTVVNWSSELNGLLLLSNGRHYIKITKEQEMHLFAWK